MKELDPKQLRAYLDQQHLMFLAGEPAVYHCHHFNLFLDQTIDDGLGVQDGTTLRMRAAREFSHRLLTAIFAEIGAETPPERMRVAASVFRTMGHGTLDVDADARGGIARGTFLHYGYSWHEKYGGKVRRRHAADAFACGYAAASVEVAFGLPLGSMEGHEIECVALRSSSCLIELRRSEPVEVVGKAVGKDDAREIAGEAVDGLMEDVIQPIAAGLQEFTAGVAGDERGVVQAFGVFVTMHLAGYYNRVSYDAVAEIARKAPQSIGVMEDLLRESGHVCVFNTFGGILLSPEWEGLVGPLSEDPLLIVAWCMAIARALGFGRWAIAEFEPEQRLVLRTPASYESVYYRTRYGLADSPNEYMLQGAALATAQLAHRVSWLDKPELTDEYYQELFKGGVPWRAVQTKAVVCGDPYSEVVVTKVK